MAESLNDLGTALILAGKREDGKAEFITAYGDASCVCGVNLHIERSWESTQALAEWGRDSGIRCFLYAHDYWPHHREAVRWLTEAAG